MPEGPLTQAQGACLVEKSVFCFTDLGLWPRMVSLFPLAASFSGGRPAAWSLLQERGAQAAQGAFHLSPSRLWPQGFFPGGPWIPGAFPFLLWAPCLSLWQESQSSPRVPPGQAGLTASTFPSVHSELQTFTLLELMLLRGQQGQRPCQGSPGVQVHLTSFFSPCSLRAPCPPRPE